jgi:uncharacterized membrane protein
MLYAAQCLHLLALVVWLGETIFLSFVVAPTLFATFPPEAGRVMSALFPWYYRIGYACGAILIVSSVALWRSGAGGALGSITVGVAAFMLAAVLYAGIVIQPRARALRLEVHGPNPSATAKAEFDRLHRRSVQLNFVVLLGGLAITAITAARLKA